MKHLFLFALIIITLEAKGQTDVVIEKKNKCKVIKEWTDTIPKGNSFKLINYNVEFIASEQNDCGNLLLIVSVLSSDNKSSQHNEEIMNIKLIWKTDERSPTTINCRNPDIPLFDTSVDKMKIGQDDELITDDKGIFEIHEDEPHKYRLYNYEREGSFIDGTTGKAIIYTYQY